MKKAYWIFSIMDERTIRYHVNKTQAINQIVNHIFGYNASGMRSMFKAAYPNKKMEIIKNPWEECWICRYEVDGKIYTHKQFENYLLGSIRTWKDGTYKETDDIERVARMYGETFCCRCEIESKETEPKLVLYREYSPEDDGECDLVYLDD
jgi:hypothetical protein